MTGLSILLFVLLAPLTVFVVWYRQQPEGRHQRRHDIPLPPPRPARRATTYNAKARQKAYYQRRIRTLQREHMLLLLAVIYTRSKA